MTIKELIKKLQCFNENHIVLLEIDSADTYRHIESSIKDVQWKNGLCVLYGEDY